MNQLPLNVVKRNSKAKPRQSVMLRIDEEVESQRPSTMNMFDDESNNHLMKSFQNRINALPSNPVSGSPSGSIRSSDMSSSDEIMSEGLPRQKKDSIARLPSGFVFTIPRILLHFIVQEIFHYAEEITITKRTTLRDSSIKILFEKKSQGQLIYTINPEIVNADELNLRSRSATSTSQIGIRSRNGTTMRKSVLITQMSPSSSRSDTNQTLANFSMAVSTIRTLDAEDEEIKPRKLKRMLSSICHDSIKISSSEEEKKEEQEQPPFPQPKKEESHNSEEEQEPKQTFRRQSHPLRITRNRTIEIDSKPLRSDLRKFFSRKYNELLYKFHSLVEDEELARVVYEDEDGNIANQLSERGKEKLKTVTIAIVSGISVFFLLLLIALIKVSIKFEDL